MKILIPIEIEARLKNGLKAAGNKEIGGILMGEEVGHSIFRVIDITIQSHPGQSSFFLRRIEEAATGLIRFFQRTGKQYQKYNYLGEWHSHPLFPTNPSQKDINSMLEIVMDAHIGANFAVLLILKLTNHDTVDGNAIAFLPNRETFLCELVMEGQGNEA